MRGLCLFINLFLANFGALGARGRGPRGVRCEGRVRRAPPAAAARMAARHAAARMAARHAAAGPFGVSAAVNFDRNIYLLPLDCD